MSVVSEFSSKKSCHRFLSAFSFFVSLNYERIIFFNRLFHFSFFLFPFLIAASFAIHPHRSPTAAFSFSRSACPRPPSDDPHSSTPARDRTSSTASARVRRSPLARAQPLASKAPPAATRAATAPSSPPPIPPSSAHGSASVREVDRRRRAAIP